MSQERWDAVDDFVCETLLDQDQALDAALEANERASLPPIALTPPQAKFLYLLARIHGASSILELGTLGGYSTIWLARALPENGRLITLELNASYADIAAANANHAGVAGLIDIRVGRALDSLRALIEEDAGPFDLVFIDADKQGTPEYFEHALELSRPGTVIVTDNVVRNGGIVDPNGEDERAQAMRRFHQQLAADRRGARRVSATTIQTVGAKGYDGFTLALVEHPEGHRR